MKIFAVFKFYNNLMYLLVIKIIFYHPTVQGLVIEGSRLFSQPGLEALLSSDKLWRGWLLKGISAQEESTWGTEHKVEMPKGLSTL